MPARSRRDRDRLMQRPTQIGGQVFVEGIPDQRVAEVELGGREPDEHVIVEQGAERAIDVDRLPPGHLGEQFELEAAADDCRSAGEFSSHRIQSGRALPHRLGDGIRHRVGPASGDELFNAQRDAVAPLVELSHEFARYELADEGVREMRGPELVEAVESYLLGGTLVHDTGAPRGQGAAARRFVAAVGGDDEACGPADHRRHPLEHLEAELVRPVQVLDLEEGWTLADPIHNEVGEIADEQPMAPGRIPVVVVGVEQAVEQGVGEVGIAVLAKCPRKVDQHRTRHLGVSRPGTRRDRGWAVQRVRDLLQHPRLADARLAGQQQEPARTLAGFCPPLPDDDEHILPADEARRDPRTRRRVTVAHEGSVFGG